MIRTRIPQHHSFKSDILVLILHVGSLAHHPQYAHWKKHPEIVGSHLSHPPNIEHPPKTIFQEGILVEVFNIRGIGLLHDNFRGCAWI